jgi:hypothetical protein
MRMAGIPSEDETYIRTLLEFASTKDLVEKILSENDKARNSDQWLIYYTLNVICQKHDRRLFIPFELFGEFPSQETITRTRRKLNEQGKCLPTDEKVIEHRQKRRRAVRDWALVDRK